MLKKVIRKKLFNNELKNLCTNFLENNFFLTLFN